MLNSKSKNSSLGLIFLIITFLVFFCSNQPVNAEVQQNQKQQTVQKQKYNKARNKLLKVYSAIDLEKTENKYGFYPFTIEYQNLIKDNKDKNFLLIGSVFDISKNGSIYKFYVKDINAFRNIFFVLNTSDNVFNKYNSFGGSSIIKYAFILKLTSVESKPVDLYEKSKNNVTESPSPIIIYGEITHIYKLNTLM